MRKFGLLAMAALSCAAWAEDGGEAQGLVEEKDYNAWHFRVGPVLSPRVRVNVSTPRMVLPAAFRSGSAKSGSSGTAPASPSAGYVARQYTDGYVKPDNGTEDPDTIIYGLTWDWGAADVPAQYSNGRMNFHTDATRWTESSSSSSYGYGSGGDSSRDLLVGVEAIGGWTYWDNRTFDAAVDAGFRFYGSGNIDASSRYGTSVTTTRNTYRIVDSYDASGWTDVPSGSYVGTPGGPGRILGAMPTRREELAGSSTSTETHYYENSARMNYRIWDLRIGPTFGWKPIERLAVRGGAYGLLGLADAELKASNGGADTSSSKCDAVFGMAFGISAQYNFTDNFFFMTGVEYDWWTDKVGLNAGGADAHLELSDMSISLALGVEF